MIFTIASFKGGVGKTTTAVHLANYLHDKDGPALLVDGDPNKSASDWAKRGPAFGCQVADLFSAPKLMGKAKHTVIDTAARPSADELESLLNGCDLLVLPTTAKALDIGALLKTVSTLKSLDESGRYVVLLTMIQSGRSAGKQARAALEKRGLQVIKRSIRFYVAHEKASLKGCLVDAVKGDRNAGIAAADYRQACEEMVAIAQEAA